MKKVLFAGTAFAALAMMTTGTASASEKIKLDLGGFSKWWVVGAWQDADYQAATAADYNSVDVKGDNEIYFKGSTKLDNGLQVGIDVQLEAGGHTDQTSDTIDESYVWLQGGFGKVVIGTEDNSANLMHVMAPDAASNWGDGGIVGGNKAIAKPTNVTTLPGGNETAIDGGGDADKITYFSPAIMGLTLGASYIPNTTQDNRSPTNLTSGGEAYTVSALYAQTFGGVGLQLSGGYLLGDTGTANRKRSEWSTGGQVSYAGFSLGGSYLQVRDSEGVGVTTSADGSGWDVGLQYATGPYAVSIAYFDSSTEGLVADAGEDEIELYQLSGKYAVGAGVTLAASLAHIEYDDESAKASGGDANHNAGWTVMTGLLLAF